jgi:hypothetical protein
MWFKRPTSCPSNSPRWASTKNYADKRINYHDKWECTLSKRPTNCPSNSPRWASTTKLRSGTPILLLNELLTTKELRQMWFKRPTSCPSNSPRWTSIAFPDLVKYYYLAPLGTTVHIQPLSGLFGSVNSSPRFISLRELLRFTWGYSHSTPIGVEELIINLSKRPTSCPSNCRG